MSTAARVWIALALVYILFFGWYTSFGGPLTPEEIEHYTAILAARGEPEGVARWRDFMESDTGDDFAMINVLDLRDSPEAVEGIEPGESSEGVMSRYTTPFLGKALRHSGRLEETLEQQRLAAEQLPDFAWAPFEAAQVLMELEQPRLAVLELQEARRRHGEPNPVIEEQWQKLQPLVLLNRVEQLQAAGSITEAFAVLRQAMAQAPEDEALSSKLMELLAAQSGPARPSTGRFLKASSTSRFPFRT